MMESYDDYLHKYQNDFTQTLNFIMLWGSYYGAIVVNMIIDEPTVTIYLEVPSSTDLIDLDGAPMCGEHLSICMQRAFNILGGRSVSKSKYIIKYRENPDLHWDYESSLESAQRMYLKLNGFLKQEE